MEQETMSQQNDEQNNNDDDDKVSILRKDQAPPPAPAEDGSEPQEGRPVENDSEGVDASDAEAADGGDYFDRLAETEAEVASLKDQLLRSMAEVENTRRRAVRDREDASRYAVTNLARDVVSVADNLRRALDSIDAGARGEDAALDALMSGVEMTEKGLLAGLERHGVKPIPSEGQPFDPHVHEAMFEVPDESVPAGTVVQVIESGYMIHDRPLRPAKVGVSRGGPKREAGAPTESGGTAADANGSTAPEAERRGQAAYEKHTDSGGPGGNVDENL